MRAVLKIKGVIDRIVWCADSFEGLPESTDVDRSFGPLDLSDREYLAVSLKKVRENFDRFNLLDDQVKLLNGWFCDTLPNATVERLALLRLDGDLYEFTKESLTYLYYKISPGGYLIIDDYHSWNGCRAAVHEFRDLHGITDQIVSIDPHAAYWRVTRNIKSSERI